MLCYNYAVAVCTVSHHYGVSTPKVEGAYFEIAFFRKAGRLPVHFRFRLKYSGIRNLFR